MLTREVIMCWKREGPGLVMPPSWDALCDLALRGLDREGWVSVPREPTLEMLEAYWAVCRKYNGLIVSDTTINELYKAMLATAPGGQEDQRESAATCTEGASSRPSSPAGFEAQSDSHHNAAGQVAVRISKLRNRNESVYGEPYPCPACKGAKFVPEIGEYETIYEGDVRRCPLCLGSGLHADRMIWQAREREAATLEAQSDSHHNAAGQYTVEHHQADHQASATPVAPAAPIAAPQVGHSAHSDAVRGDSSVQPADAATYSLSSNQRSAIIESCKTHGCNGPNLTRWLYEADLRATKAEAESAKLRAAEAEVVRLDNSACKVALDDIAKLCGCAYWEYPGQVVRDVIVQAEQCGHLQAEIARLRQGPNKAEVLCATIGVDIGLTVDERVKVCRAVLRWKEQSK